MVLLLIGLVHLSEPNEQTLDYELGNFTGSNAMKKPGGYRRAANHSASSSNASG